MLGIGFAFAFIRMFSVPFWLVNTGGAWKAVPALAAAAAVWALAVPPPQASAAATAVAPIH